MSSAYYESAEASDVGKKRKNNEDACLRLPDRGVYCVADGMGGQAGGDLASAAIITSLQQVFDKAAPEDDATFSRRIALFKKGTNQASKWIKSFSDEKVIGQMGSTVVALVIDPRNPARAVSLHAGDSRMYLFRKGELKQVTADHSAVAVLAAKLGRSPESIPAKFQNDLLRAVGLSESVELEKNSMLVVSGDLFLICTDGLTKMQSDQQIAKILNDGLKIPLADVAQNLIKAANEAGGKDNVTAILIKAGDLINAPCEIDLEEEEEEEDKTLPTPTVSLPANENPHPDGADVQDDTPVTENITREELSSERPATTTSAAATIQNSAAQNVSAKTNSGSQIESRQPSERKRNFSPSRLIFAAIKATKAAIRSKPTAGVPNPPAAKPVSAPVKTSGPSFVLDLQDMKNKGAVAGAVLPKISAEASVAYEELLVWFNLKNPTDPYIQTAVARKQTPLNRALSDHERNRYLATVTGLENEFGKLGILNQNARVKFLVELKGAIARHE